jgi:hypothetical protein
MHLLEILIRYVLELVMLFEPKELESVSQGFRILVVDDYRSHVSSFVLKNERVRCAVTPKGPRAGAALKGRTASMDAP